MIVAKIDRDYQELGCVGLSWSKGEIDEQSELGALDFTNVPTQRFRCLDDDEIPYFGGWLLNDNWCEVQDAVLRWGMRDSGTTIIEVRDKKTGEWKREI